MRQTRTNIETVHREERKGFQGRKNTNTSNVIIVVVVHRRHQQQQQHSLQNFLNYGLNLFEVADLHIANGHGIYGHKTLNASILNFICKNMSKLSN